MTHCPNNLRHWYAARGLPGVIVPECVRCGAPNPKWTAAVEHEMELMGFGAAWRRTGAHR